MAQEFDTLANAVKMAESRGQRFDPKNPGTLLTSPKGAQGEMQVLPKTQTDPGFGVVPARDQSPAEIARVGNDYLKAMLDRYGNEKHALIGYNWGPGNTDKWLSEGARHEKLPAETKGYLQKVQEYRGKPLTSGVSNKKMTELDLNGAGESYKTALAMSFLVDSQGKEGKKDEEQALRDDMEAEKEDAAPVSPLAGLKLAHKSPFAALEPQEPQQFAVGGEVEGGEADKSELPDLEYSSEPTARFIKGANKMSTSRGDLENMMMGLGLDSGMVGMDISKMKQGDRENLARNLMAAYRAKVGDVDVNASIARPLDAPAGVYMGGVSAGIPVGNRDRVIVGAGGLRTPEESRITGYNLGYSGEVGPGRLDVMAMQPKGYPSGRSYQLQYRMPFADGGVVHRADGSPQEGELTQAEIDAASKPYTGNPHIQRQGEAARALAAQRDVNTLPDPKTYAAVSGFMGTPFQEQGWSVFHPKRKEIEQAADTGFAAGTVAQVAPVFGALKGIATEGTTAAKMLSGLKDMPVGMSVKPTEGIFTHLPSSEAPFVGRLDEYISALPGPVQKQQFVGQLKNKFRDYEIGRAEEALKDLPANAKLTPSDLLNRVKGVYDPGRYKTTVLPPEPNSSDLNNRWRSMDNVYYNKDTNEGVHLGVIHLNQDIPPEVAQRQMAAHEASRAVRMLGDSDWRVARYPEKLDALENFLKTSGVQLEPELAKKLQTGSDQYRKIMTYENEMNAAKDKLLYPSIDPRYEELHNKYLAKAREADPLINNYAVRAQMDGQVVQDLANEANAWLQSNGYKPVKLPDFNSIHTPSAHGLLDQDYANSVKNAFADVKEHVAKADNNLSKYMKGTEEQFKKAVGHELPYMGQHSSLEGGPGQISFSRYSEHTANIPGIGPTQGIYVHELQSDMLDDLRKLGPKRGSKAMDQEEYADTVKKLEGLEKSRAEAYSAGNSKLAEELDNQILSAGGRADVLSKRMRSPDADYSMNEAFHRMETGGKTAQQLMAKNAVIGAIQQGKNFVAFPGVESAQAKLYEKLPRNLKDVVKDLGPGFDLRDVTLTNQDGNQFTHHAIVWGPEAAARIQKKGVPFATGGAVDKANSDHRKYL